MLVTDDNKIKTRQMKWWGWGDPNKSFTIDDKPGLWPYMTKALQLQETRPTLPVDLASIELPESRINPSCIAALTKILAPEQIKQDKLERLIHTYGKSFRDLWRIRHGILSQAPDLVLYPQTEDEVAAIIAIANEYDVVVIPFGGGSNIAGCVEMKDRQQRPFLCLDMKKMDQVLSVDQHSGIARIQAGIMGPDLENQLQPYGLTLGHFPDSFEYSTLGGWVATRSAGMQSDQFGKIEDMVISLRMVTPQGTLVTRTVPRASNGIDMNHICMGSEGILGIITEVTIAVHPISAFKDYYGYLFPNFFDGVAAIHECAQQNCLPMLARLNDSQKTALSFAFKTRTSWLKSLPSKIIKLYLAKIRKINFEQACLMITSFAGENQRQFLQQKKQVHAIFKRHRGICLGTTPGRTFARTKYDFPYLRDFAMDHNLMTDVSETATIWSNLKNLYIGTKTAIEQAIRETGYTPWVGCHMSHNYYSGASLYFTFACEQKAGEELNQYLHIKKAAEDAFLKFGGTLSHHHAVGYEHLPWLEADISTPGVYAVQALKQSLDPKHIMNPGKLIPSKQALADWGYSIIEKPPLKNYKIKAPL